MHHRPRRPLVSWPVGPSRVLRVLRSWFSLGKLPLSVRDPSGILGERKIRIVDAVATEARGCVRKTRF
jgi:hypothetical protein